MKDPEQYLGALERLLEDIPDGDVGAEEAAAEGKRLIEAFLADNGGDASALSARIEREFGAEASCVYAYCYDVLFGRPRAVYTFGEGRRTPAAQGVVLHRFRGDLEEVMDGLETFMKGFQEESFGEYLTGLIRDKKLDHVEVYKRARLNTKDFSRITNKSTISRENAYSLAVGLQLSPEETEDFLRHAGYGIRHCRFDAILMFCIEHKIYDIDVINLLLFREGQRTLRDNTTSIGENRP